MLYVVGALAALCVFGLVGFLIYTGVLGRVIRSHEAEIASLTQQLADRLRERDVAYAQMKRDKALYDSLLESTAAVQDENVALKQELALTFIRLPNGQFAKRK